jgi:hypothetical protein
VQPYRGPGSVTILTQSAEQTLESSARLAILRANALQILDGARAKFPMIRQALLLRLTGLSTQLDIPACLPTNVLHALATAQVIQNNGLAVGRASAKADAAAGGQLGASLSSVLASDFELVYRGSRVVASPAYAVSLHPLEVLGGSTPLIAIMTAITRDHHNPTNAAPGAALLKLATEITIVSKNALNIKSGCAAFLTAYHETISRGTLFSANAVFRALVANLAPACAVDCVITTTSTRASWRDDCNRILLDHGRRIPELEGGPPYLPGDLMGLVDWLEVWSQNVMRFSANMDKIAHSTDITVLAASLLVDLRRLRACSRNRRTRSGSSAPRRAGTRPVRP